MDEHWRKAAIEGDLATIDAQIEAGADVDAKDKFGQTALMLAAPRGHEAIVRRLIEAGADLNVTAKFGLSAVMLAVVNHRPVIAEALARAGADLRLRGKGEGGFYGKTAAELARENGQVELAGSLDGLADGTD
ncbi:MAG: ankyrin repeat domain-containing protein [Alphaproteobacteria bacterium]|nr:ankyrin repeat domain-containing protein [Alphaproteobacteria bacterium]